MDMVPLDENSVAQLADDIVAQGRGVIEQWRRHYNTVRPHSAIGNKPPISLMNGSSAQLPP